MAEWRKAEAPPREADPREARIRTAEAELGVAIRALLDAGQVLRDTTATLQMPNRDGQIHQEAIFKAMEHLARARLLEYRDTNYDLREQIVTSQNQAQQQIEELQAQLGTAQKKIEELQAHKDGIRGDQTLRERDQTPDVRRVAGQGVAEASPGTRKRSTAQRDQSSEAIRQLRRERDDRFSRRPAIDEGQSQPLYDFNFGPPIGPRGRPGERQSGQSLLMRSLSRQSNFERPAHRAVQEGPWASVMRRSVSEDPFSEAGAPSDHLLKQSQRSQAKKVAEASKTSEKEQEQAGVPSRGEMNVEKGHAKSAQEESDVGASASKAREEHAPARLDTEQPQQEDEEEVQEYMDTQEDAPPQYDDEMLDESQPAHQSDEEMLDEMESPRQPPQREAATLRSGRHEDDQEGSGSSSLSSLSSVDSQETGGQGDQGSGSAPEIPPTGPAVREPRIVDICVRDQSCIQNSILTQENKDAMNGDKWDRFNSFVERIGTRRKNQPTSGRKLYPPVCWYIGGMLNNKVTYTWTKDKYEAGQPCPICPRNGKQCLKKKDDDTLTLLNPNPGDAARQAAFNHSHNPNIQSTPAVQSTSFVPAVASAGAGGAGA